MQGGSKQTTDLGQLFFGFLRRFGSHFNLYTDAVAIGLGGIVSKKSASVNGEDTGLPKLCVQDINTLRSVHTMLPAQAACSTSHSLLAQCGARTFSEEVME